MVRRGDGGQTAAIGDALQAWIGGRGQARSLDEHGEGYVVGSLRHCGAGADHVVETGQQRPAARQVDGENVVAGTATGVAPPADTDRLLVFEPGKVLDGEGAWCPAQPVLEAGRGSSRAQAAQDITQSTVLDALGAGHLDPPGGDRDPSGQTQIHQLRSPQGEPKPVLGPYAYTSPARDYGEQEQFVPRGHTCRLGAAVRGGESSEDPRADFCCRPHRPSSKLRRGRRRRAAAPAPGRLDEAGRSGPRDDGPVRPGGSHRAEPGARRGFRAFSTPVGGCPEVRHRQGETETRCATQIAELLRDNMASVIPRVIPGIRPDSLSYPATPGVTLPAAYAARSSASAQAGPRPRTHPAWSGRRSGARPSASPR